MIRRILALVRAELGRLASQKTCAALVGASVLVAVGSTLLRDAAGADAPGGPTSGFGLLLDATRDAAWPLALAGWVLGALSVSQELGGRTLANWLVGPVRRSEILVAKAVALLLAVAAGASLTIAAAALLATRVASFGPVTLDELVLVDRADLVRDTAIGLGLFGATLLVWPLVGLAIGTVSRGVAPALTAGSLLFVATAAVVFAGEEVPRSEAWFAIWPIEFLGIARDKALGISSAYWDAESIGFGLAIAAGTGLIALAVSLGVFTRMEVRG